MNFLRGIVLLVLGCVVGVLLAPRLPKLEAGFGEVIEKVKARARPSSPLKEARAPVRPAAVPAPQPVRPLKVAEAGEIGRLMGIPDEATPGKISKALEQSGGRWAVADAR